MPQKVPIFSGELRSNNEDMMSWQAFTKDYVGKQTPNKPLQASKGLSFWHEWLRGILNTENSCDL